MTNWMIKRIFLASPCIGFYPVGDYIVSNIRTTVSTLGIDCWCAPILLLRCAHFVRRCNSGCAVLSKAYCVFSGSWFGPLFCDIKWTHFWVPGHRFRRRTAHFINLNLFELKGELKRSLFFFVVWNVGCRGHFCLQLQQWILAKGVHKKLHDPLSAVDLKHSVFLYQIEYTSSNFAVLCLFLWLHLS